MGMIVLEARSLGQQDRHEATIDWPPPERNDDDSILVRELIAAAVEARWDSIRDVKRLRAAFWRTLATVLGRETEEPESAPEGRQASGASGSDLAKMRHAVSAAWDGFEQEQYYLLVDGRRMLKLDQRVKLGGNNRVTFLRRLEFASG